MTYATRTVIKQILDIKESTWDTEIDGCVTSSDALVDSLLKKAGLSVPASVPQNVKDASNHFGAWLFRRRRDAGSAEAFWAEGMKFLDAYTEANREIAFKVASA